MSDIIDYSGNYGRKENIHIDVDAILAEPISPSKPVSHLKKNKTVYTYQIKGHTNSGANTTKSNHKVLQHKREKLIIHDTPEAETGEGNLKRILYSILGN